jgi:hypothetical protein
MTEETNKVWLDELTEQIEEMLADPKQVKFNTHRNRKAFTSKLIGLLKDAIHKNTLPKPEGRSNGLVITRPNPDGNKGFSVMTEALSQKGDDVRESVNAKNNAEAKKKSVNVW